MKERGPAISVVIPAYKAEAFIARAVTSVLAQPHVCPEIIVVVDGIYDRTAQIAGGFPGVTVLVNYERRGASAARNRGLAAASASFVLFLDADDYIEGTFLNDLLVTAKEQALDLVFGPGCKEWPDGRRDFFRPIKSRNSLEIVCYWIAVDMVPDCSVLWRRDFLYNIGAWREDLANMEDVELTWRGILGTPNVAYDTTARGCGVYVQHDGERVTSQRTAQSLRSILDVYRGIRVQLSSRGDLPEPTRKALRSKIYANMRLSYIWKFDSIAKEFALEWKELGGDRHEGTLLHRVSCTVIGLRWKQRLSVSRVARSSRAALAVFQGAHGGNRRGQRLAQRMDQQRTSV